MDEWNRSRSLQADEPGFEQDDADRGAKHARARDARRKAKLDDALDRALEDSFPGSDPISVAQPLPSARDKPEI
jgi:hypothetical protein